MKIHLKQNILIGKEILFLFPVYQYFISFNFSCVSESENKIQNENLIKTKTKLTDDLVTNKKFKIRRYYCHLLTVRENVLNRNF